MRSLCGSSFKEEDMTKAYYSIVAALAISAFCTPVRAFSFGSYELSVVQPQTENSLPGEQSTERLKLPVPSIAVFARLPRFGEGLVFDLLGRLYVSDSFDNAILRLTETGETEVWSRAVNFPNGHKVLPDGTHIVMGQGAVVWLDANGQVIKQLTTDEQGRQLRSPNDITLDQRNGGFYFTDPGVFRADESGRVFYVDQEGNIRTVSDGVIDFPNGIVLRPDGRTLLVTERLQNRILEFRVREPGRLSAPRVFAELPSQPNPLTNGESVPDGMALDEAGNLYVAHYGAGVVRVFDRHGHFLGSLGVGSPGVTNLAFGGQNMDELYVYAVDGNPIEEINPGGRIMRLTLPGVRGLRLIPAQE
ncbi:SMP-30/gluconolactonase/LRE family protein [Scytonema sp. NUACC21]